MFYDKLHHIIFELNAGYEIPQHIDIYQEQHSGDRRGVDKQENPLLMFALATHLQMQCRIHWGNTWQL